MHRRIILHHLNAVDASGVEFVKLAADNDCHRVTMFGFDGGLVLPRSNSGLRYPAPIAADMKQDMLSVLGDCDVSIDGLEFFPLTAEVDFEQYRPALALGRELGARRVVTHIFIEDDVLVIDRLGEFCELAATEGMVVSSEFCPLTPGNPSLDRARWLVDQLGRDDFGIGVDMLHVVRSGATAVDLVILEPRYFGIVQICDAFGTEVSADYIVDVHNREVPGQGDLPLHDLLNGIPSAMPIEVEVPAAHRRAAGVTAAEHVREVLAGTRAIVADLAPVR